MKTKFYSLKKILEANAQYNVIIGERSNGKTYAVLKYGIENYMASKKQLAIVRRWQDDFIGKRGQTMFDSLVANGEIEKITKGEWSNVHYYASKWYLCRYEDNGKKTERVIDTAPFAYGFAITSMEHDKSTSYPNITTICFDEFLTRTAYVPDEFVMFMNVVSTIIRHRTDVKIFMLGNTVNRYCPYFTEMGLRHVKDMKQGTIDLYHYGDTDLKVAVEYCKPNKQGKASDLYFAFDNPKLQMITGGTWELDMYPHCPIKYRPKDVLFTYFICFNDDVLQCEIIHCEGMHFTFIHRKTTPLKYADTDLIYTTDFDARPNFARKITKPTTPLQRKICDSFIKDKVFYADNEVGEIVRNYLLWCK